MAGVWAVAATAVALIALLDTSGDDAQRKAGEASSEVAGVQRTLGRRIDAIDKRLDGLAPSGDVSKLQARLGRAEDDASSASSDAKGAGKKVSDLEDRVKQLEDDSAGANSGSGAGDASPGGAKKDGASP